MLRKKTCALTHSLIWLLCLFQPVTGVDVEEDTIHRSCSDKLLYQPSNSLDFGLESNDTIVPPDAFSPWSYEPVCTPRLSQIESKLCVYTDRHFGNGRGISLFTTPEIAAGFATVLSSLQDPSLVDTLGTNSFTGSWYTRTIPGKGVGMLAKRDLNRGDTITAYTPVLLAYKEHILSKAQREKFLRLAVTQLPAPSRESYLELATISDDPSILAQDIASANSFEMRLGGEKGSTTAAHLAIIPESSRMNHDCAPNAIFHVNSSTLTHVVRATRPIPKGQEITIAYTSPLEPRATRQKYLSNAFHFTCTCSRCLRGADADADADAVLTEIVALQRTLSAWSDPHSAASVAHAERLLRLHREEGLDGYLDPAYCYAALVYSSVGSARGAKKYAELAIEAIELRLGPGAPDLPAWRDLLDDPTRHWSWMMRKRSSSGRENG